MMQTKELIDVLKAAPSVSDATGKSILLKDSNGSLSAVSGSAFVRTAKCQIPANTVLRIKGITSVFIAVRGTIGPRSLLVWISTYGEGTTIRTQWAKIHTCASYKLYINGPSETQACAYLVLNDVPNGDWLAVTSIFGEQPIIEQVASLPSDVALISY